MRSTQGRRLLVVWMLVLFLAASTSQASPQSRGSIGFEGKLTDDTSGMGDPGMVDPGIPGGGLFGLFDMLDDGLSNGSAVEASYHKYDLQIEYVADVKESAFVDVLDYYTSYAPERAKLVTVSVK
jgi:hypothetical protein